ncbi:hypothetical protein [Archaeoglobus sp.]
MKELEMEKVREAISKMSVELQRLEAMLMPEEEEFSDEELEEILREATDPKIKWIKADEILKKL